MDNQGNYAYINPINFSVNDLLIVRAKENQYFVMEVIEFKETEYVDRYYVNLKNGNTFYAEEFNKNYIDEKSLFRNVVGIVQPTMIDEDHHIDIDDDYPNGEFIVRHFGKDDPYKVFAFALFSDEKLAMDFMRKIQVIKSKENSLEIPPKAYGIDFLASIGYGVQEQVQSLTADKCIRASTGFDSDPMG